MLIVTAGFKESLLTASSYAKCSGVCHLAIDKMWRVLIGKLLALKLNPISYSCVKNLGFGAVPACIALYYRLTIPETPRYTFDVARDVEKASEDVVAYIAGKDEGNPDGFRRAQALKEAEALVTPKASWSDFIHFYSQWQNGKVLLGTAGSWFCLDIAYYGLSLNTATVLAAIGYTTGSTVYEILKKTAVGNIIIVCAGAIPGYWTTVALVDTVGRKPIQLGSFVILTILFIIWGFDYNKMSSKAMLGIYCICNFFFNFGML